MQARDFKVVSPVSLIHFFKNLPRHLYHIRQGIKHSDRGSYTIFLDLQPKVRTKLSFVGGRGRSARLLQNRGEADVFTDRGGH